MLADVPHDEYQAALDACAADLLWEAEVDRPPVDARRIAGRLGLVVAANAGLSCRAHHVRLAGKGPCEPGGQGTIVVGPAERPEREQWSIAHEIGESAAWRVFERLGVPPGSVPPQAREQLANRLAACLLLPREWFGADGSQLDWDLFALKERYGTASHELIARRMLEMHSPIVITLWDLGAIVWRRSNVAGRVPSPIAEEKSVWCQSHASGVMTSTLCDQLATGLQRVRCWPIHEPDWKREILRSELSEA